MVGADPVRRLSRVLRDDVRVAYGPCNFQPSRMQATYVLLMTCARKGHLHPPCSFPELLRRLELGTERPLTRASARAMVRSVTRRLFLDVEFDVSLSFDPSAILRSVCKKFIDGFVASGPGRVVVLIQKNDSS